MRASVEQGSPILLSELFGLVTSDIGGGHLTQRGLCPLTEAGKESEERNFESTIRFERV